MRGLVKKALKDLISTGKRSMTAFIAMTLGISFFGMMLFSYQIIRREIQQVYRHSNPSSAVVTVQGAEDYKALDELTKRMSESMDYEIKSVQELQIMTGNGDWKPLYLFGIHNIANKEINQINLLEGELPGKEGKALIEEGAIQVADASIEDTVTIKDGMGIESQLLISGSVKDMSVHPPFIHGCVYLYVPIEYMKGANTFLVEILLKENTYEKETIEMVCNDYVSLLKKQGYNVINLEIPKVPGENMHYKEYDSALFLLRIIAFVASLLGSMIMGNLISSIMAAKVREIGILKSIGTKPGQIYKAYLIAFEIILGISFLCSLTIVAFSSDFIARLLMSLGNLIPENTGVPFWDYGLFTMVSMLVPLLLILVPIRRGVKATIKEAFEDYGISYKGVFKNRTWDSKLKLPSTILLASKNLLRKKRTLILNLITLSFGGVVFIVIFTIQFSLKSNLMKYMNSQLYDYQFILGGASNEAETSKMLSKVDTIKEYEIWKITKATYVDGEEEVPYQLIAPQDHSRLFAPIMLEGDWLQYDNNRKVVISEELQKEQKLRLGDPIKLMIEGSMMEGSVGGIVKLFEEKVIFLPQASLSQYVDLNRCYSSVKCKTNKVGFSDRRHYNNLASQLKENGIIMMNDENKKEIADTLFNHYAVTLNTLLMVSLLLVVVAGFGLAASLNTQLDERRNEMAIMKAIGAGNKVIRRITMYESLMLLTLSLAIVGLIGLASALVGCIQFGKLIFDRGIIFDVVSFIKACGIWGILIMGVGLFTTRRCVMGQLRR